MAHFRGQRSAFGTPGCEPRWTDADKRLAEQVSAYWVNFATTGDPNGRSLPKWDAYQTKDDRAMGFADAPAMIPVPNKAALDFFDTYMQRSRATRSQN